MPRPVQKALHTFFQILFCHPRQRLKIQVHEIPLAQPADGSDIASEERGVGLGVGQIGLLLGQLPDVLQQKHAVDDRLFTHQRAVVVEHRDAFFRRHIGGGSLGRHRREEIDDRLFCFSLVPTRQGIDRQRLPGIRSWIRPGGRDCQTGRQAVCRLGGRGLDGRRTHTHRSHLTTPHRDSHHS